MFVVENRPNTSAATSPTSKLKQQKQSSKTNVVSFCQQQSKFQLNNNKLPSSQPSLVADASRYDQSLMLLSAVARSRDSTPRRMSEQQKSIGFVRKTSETQLHLSQNKQFVSETTNFLNKVAMATQSTEKIAHSSKSSLDLLLNSTTTTKITTQKRKFSQQISTKTKKDNNCCSCTAITKIAIKKYDNNNLYHMTTTSNSLNSFFSTTKNCPSCALNFKNFKAKLSQSLNDLPNFQKMCTNCSLIVKTKNCDNFCDPFFKKKFCEKSLICQTLKTISEDMNLLVQNITKEAKTLVQAEM